MNRAATAVEDASVTVQVSPDPTQGPVQPAKDDPDAGAASRVTDDPVGKVEVHVVPVGCGAAHERPTGSLVTVPAPDPGKPTSSVFGGMGANVAESGRGSVPGR